MQHKTKCYQERNTGLGKTQSELKMDFAMTDPFFDSYEQEVFLCHDIIDKMKVGDDNLITVTINKVFLKKVLYSHINIIRKIV